MKEENVLKESFEGYNYTQVMKKTILWLPLIAFLLVVCTYFTAIRFLLYIVVVGTAFRYILKKMNAHKDLIEFDEEAIRINNDFVPYSDIIHYYTCLPLNKLFMLRITTVANEKKMWYIDVRDRERLEAVMMSKQVIRKKLNFDVWLQYRHLLFAFYVLFLTLFIIIVIGRIFPALKIL